jgi:hypothetical protein
VLGLLAIKPEHQHAIADRGALQVRGHTTAVVSKQSVAGSLSLHV